MKTLKSILTVFALAAVFSSASFAQETQDINIGAVVLADITVDAASDVVFGNIQDSGSPVLDPQGASTADVGATAALGTIDISAANSTQLLISWDQATVTLGNGATGTMTYTPDVAGNSADDASTATDISSGVAGSGTETSAGGLLYLFIGGDLGTLSSQESGTYASDETNGSGDLTFTINYQ